MDNPGLPYSDFGKEAADTVALGDAKKVAWCVYLAVAAYHRPRRRAVRSRDHVVPSVLAERRLRDGKPASVADLLTDVQTPPLAEIGAMSMDDFLPERERSSLAKAMNTLLASPTLESWPKGSPLHIAQWPAPREDRRTPAVIVSEVRVDDEPGRGNHGAGGHPDGRIDNLVKYQRRFYIASNVMQRMPVVTFCCLSRYRVPSNWIRYSMFQVG